MMKMMERGQSKKNKNKIILISRLSKRSWVTPALDFYDVELCHGRSVNNLDWSIKV